MDELREYILAELKRRDWNQTDLARAARVSRQSISTLLNRTTNPNPDTLKALARALNRPIEHIYRLAGILPPEDSRKVAEQVLGYKLRDLNESEIEQVIDFVEYLYQKKEREQGEPEPPPIYYKQQRRRPHREGEIPPESV